jgi:hypothetical protein
LSQRGFTVDDNFMKSLPRWSPDVASVQRILIFSPLLYSVDGSENYDHMRAVQMSQESPRKSFLRHDSTVNVRDMNELLWI